MKNINIYFCDFWADFNNKNNVFVGALSLAGYNVNVLNLPDNDTDLIFCSCFGNEHVKYVNCKKLIYYSGENDFPTFLDYDYAITHNTMTHARHLRIPLWVAYNYDYKLKHAGEGILELKPVADVQWATTRKFCADVISNTTVAWPLRFKVSDQLEAKYKPLSHGGSYKNNVGGKVDDKYEFFKTHKFAMATENSLIDGYVTEKIYDCFMTRTIPIYLGAPDVDTDFNSKAFINVSNYKNFNDLIARVKELDENDDLYMQMLNEQPLAEENLYDKHLLNMGKFLSDIIEHGTIRCHKYGRIGVKYMRHEF